MKQSYPEYWPQYFTATVHQWKHLLIDDNYKNIVTSSFEFLVNKRRIALNTFVIMSNHLHLIWQPLFGFAPFDIQASFMKFTAYQFEISMLKNNASFLEEFKVNKYDREYPIWKREPLSIELRSPGVFEQKLNYIHNNPVRAGLCVNPEDYYYSSAKFYDDRTDYFGILTHDSGN